MSDFISSAASQAAELPPGGGGIKSLGDLTDLKKLMPPGATQGLQTDLKGMASKMNELGAKFKDPAAAKAMFAGIETPNAPNFNSAFSSLKDMMNQHKPTLDGLTGTGTGPLGLPSVGDFTAVVTGGPAIDNLLNGPTTPEKLQAITDMSNKAKSLFTAAGVDLDAPPPAPTLGSLMKAATSLHKIGADASGSGAADALKKMIPDGSVFGDAIKTAMAEGKNMKAMAAAGIKPPQFNPFEGLPSAPDNIGSEAAAKLLGG